MGQQYHCGNCEFHCPIPQWTLEQYRGIVQTIKNSPDWKTVKACQSLLNGESGALYCHKDNIAIICETVVISYGA